MCECMLSMSAFPILQFFYDLDANLSRIDLAAETVSPFLKGVLSVIQDPATQVMYLLYRQYSNCSILPLTMSSDLVPESDNHYHLRNLNNLFLLSELDYDYAGNMSAHGIILDNWKFSGNFSHAGFSYTDAKVQWSVTQPGQVIAGVSSVRTSATLWRLAVEGLTTPTSTEDSTPTNLSSVSRLFDLSFDEPSSDVFDALMCADPRDTVSLTLAIPELSARDSDLSALSGRVKRAVANYTEVYPIQIGHAEVSLCVMACFPFTESCKAALAKSAQINSMCERALHCQTTWP